MYFYMVVTDVELHIIVIHFLFFSSLKWPANIIENERSFQY